MGKKFNFTRLMMAPFLLSALAVSAPTPAQAQIPALLPSMENVEPLDALPIDGAWRIREINQPIMIEDGYAYAINGWTHALIFRIMPGQVVLSGLTEAADGTIRGRDLPLMLPITMEQLGDATVRVTAHGIWPIIYHLDRADGSIPDQGPPDYDAPDQAPPDDGGSWFPADEEELSW